MSINANNAALNEILEAINELPEAGNGKTEIETTIDITENGETVVTPDDENTTLSKVIVNVDVPVKEEQEKVVDITGNGTTEVTPNEGKALSKVTVNVEVASSGDEEYEWQEDNSPIVYEKTCYQNPRISACVTENGTLTYKRNRLEYPDSNPKWAYSNLTQMIGSHQTGGVHWLNVRQAEVVNIPEATEDYLITKLDNCTFALLYNLKIIKLPDTITALGNSVFQECYNLKTIELPAATSTMGSAVFRNCSRLKEFIIPPLVTQLSPYTFTSCISLETVNGIERMTSIGTSCFDGCPKLRGTVILNEALLELSNSTFRDCVSLEKIIFKGIPTTVASGVFSNCVSIKDIYVPWAEGEVDNAPWGATNATIHYNTTYDANGNPQCPCHSSTEV